ncbi:VPLPA-CTERM sorting domain-containing protein [uncultured Roseobacter sp.]|uniref:VPLPA-CTERM sorting domain-containing protein n=1 Tax=uncultured Roseobacter sp. TaxID=114847 RepID=UPI00260853C9|nr:VPLPA-CTERM sorting domain-containing protein [uncultured Roseobacter sp.]
MKVFLAGALAFSMAAALGSGAYAAVAGFDDPDMDGLGEGSCFFPQGRDGKEILASAVTGVSDVQCSGTQPNYSNTDSDGDVSWTAFGGMTFKLADKSDGAEGNDYIGYTDGLTDATPSDTTWAIDLKDTVDVVAIVLGFKQGSNYAAFMVAPDDDYMWSGTWSIFDNGNLSNNYSHLDLWYKTGERPMDPEDPPMVPLPAAGWMLVAGLGGLGAMRRFRKA